MSLFLLHKIMVCYFFTKINLCQALNGLGTPLGDLRVVIKKLNNNQFEKNHLHLNIYLVNGSVLHL